MAQQQHAADVHPDELCPQKKRYDLMDANKKVDLEHVQCPPESKILTNIIKNHLLQFRIVASSSVPWIYMAQFCHTLKEDGSKYRLTFMLDKKELSLTLDNFRTIFHLPQANADNHDSFVKPPSFLDMVPFFKQQLGFTMELKTSSSFKTTGLLQPWQTLCKIFSKCLTTRVTRWDQPPLQIMKMMYCFVNNIHVDYAELLWEGLYYSLHHPTSSIPYPRFIKIIISHYMTSIPEILRRARDRYHNLKDDDIMKNIFNSGRYKDKVGMQIPDWMISEEMKHTKHYQMYAEVFGLDVPLTQRSTRLTPPAPLPTVDKADEMILQDTLQVSLAEHKIREDQEARENVEVVKEHLASVEIEKMVEGTENVIDDSLLPRNDESKIPSTRLEPRSDKESPEVEITNDEEVEITNVVIPVNVNKEEEEITDEVYDLKQKEKGKIVEEFLSRKSFDTLADHLQEVMVKSLPTMVDTHIQEQVKKQVPEQVPQTTCRTFSVRPRDQDDPHDDAHPEGENLAKRQKTSKYEAYVSADSSSGQVNENEQGPSTSGNQEQEDDYDFWTESYALDDDEILTKQMSQDIMEEVSLTIDEAKIKKMVDEIKKEILVSSHPRKTTPLVQSCQRDPEASPLSLINQDLFYLKKGSSRPEKIVLLLHKFPVIIFNDDDIEERTSRWVNKCVKKFNHYARYGVKHWKNPRAKIFYIRKQKEPGKPKEVIYSNSKIIQVINRKLISLHQQYLSQELKNTKCSPSSMSLDLTNEEVEYLKLFEEEIEVRLKYRNQMRRWEMYVNGRPLGPRRERPE
ncbi:hypothetical protein Tco_1532799 [Tanacetum coccineum]